VGPRICRSKNRAVISACPYNSRAHGTHSSEAVGRPTWLAHPLRHCKGWYCEKNKEQSSMYFASFSCQPQFRLLAGMSGRLGSK
jgi:hypothetical protein